MSGFSVFFQPGLTRKENKPKLRDFKISVSFCSSVYGHWCQKIWLNSQRTHFVKPENTGQYGCANCMHFCLLCLFRGGWDKYCSYTLASKFKTFSLWSASLARKLWISYKTRKCFLLDVAYKPYFFPNIEKLQVAWQGKTWRIFY